MIQQQIAAKPPSEAPLPEPPPPEPPPHCTNLQSTIILPNGEILPMNGEIDLVTNKILNEPIKVEQHPTAPHTMLKRELDNYPYPDILTRLDSMYKH